MMCWIARYVDDERYCSRRIMTPALTNEWSIAEKQLAFVKSCLKLTIAAPESQVDDGR